jgi:ferredoxin
MISLSINNKQIEVTEGTTLLQAAAMAGFDIPTLCHLKDISTHPSCMVCTVKDLANGKLYPSCAMPASEGMQIITGSDELSAFRKDAIDLLLSEHLGDCEAPCRLSCPAFMDIPLMNRLISEGKFEEASAVVREEIALPYILGYICPAPCEKACKRKPIDGAVSICLLKRFTAAEDKAVRTVVPSSGKRVAILGTGPAGLSAAFFLLQKGHECILFDKQEEAGGALRYSIPDAELPREVLEAEINNLTQMGAIFILNERQSFSKLRDNGFGTFDAFILATGSQETHPPDEAIHPEAFHHHFINKDTFETSIPGVFACGNIIRDQKMAVRAGAQGKAAALQADRFLNGLPSLVENDRFNSTLGQLKEEEFVEYLKESQPLQRTAPANENGFTAMEAIIEAKRCMHCDCRKAESCSLRKVAQEYGADKRHFAGINRQQMTKSLQHEWIVFEPGKCIKCGICIEIAGKASEFPGLTFIGRGFDVRIAAPFSKSIADALRITALDCARACPTAAIAEKNMEERFHYPDEKS